MLNYIIFIIQFLIDPKYPITKRYVMPYHIVLIRGYYQHKFSQLEICKLPGALLVIYDALVWLCFCSGDVRIVLEIVFQ